MPRILDAGRVLFDDAGNLLSGGSVTFYENGTLTVKATYSDAALTVQNAASIPIDSDGRLPVEVFGTGLYTARAVDMNGREGWAEDDLGDDPASATYTPSHTGAVSRTLKSKLDEFVSVKDFGATGDGVTDDTSAIQAALDSGDDAIIIPPGTYVTSSTLNINSVGTRFIGSGDRNAVRILATHTTGPVIKVTERECIVSGIYIDASDTRNAASVTTDCYGLMVGGAAANSLSRGRYEDLLIARQPSHGVYMGSAGPGTIFSKVSSSYNRGHGFMFDDGTLAGDTPARLGIVRIENCRADESGGNSLNISQSNSSCFRFVVENFESLNPAWNTAISGLVDCGLYLGGENHEIKNCAWGDSGYASATMANGDDRATKGATGDGIQLRTGASNIVIDNNRFIDCTISVDATTNVKGLRVTNPYITPTQTYAVRYTTGALGVHIEMITDSAYPADVTYPVSAGTTGGYLRNGDTEYLIYAGNNNNLQLSGVVTATIASGALNCLGVNVSMSGEGDTTDDLNGVYFAGGSNPLPDGVTVRLINLEAYNITVKHGVTNIYTKTGADVVLGQNEGITLLSMSGNAYEV